MGQKLGLSPPAEVDLEQSSEANIRTQQGRIIVERIQLCKEELNVIMVTKSRRMRWERWEMHIKF